MPTARGLNYVTPSGTLPSAPSGTTSTFLHHRRGRLARFAQPPGRAISCAYQRFAPTVAGSQFFARHTVVTPRTKYPQCNENYDM
jgi:hypothetical protein